MNCEKQALYDYMQKEPQKSAWVRMTGRTYNMGDAEYSCGQNLTTPEAFSVWLWAHAPKAGATNDLSLNKNVSNPSPQPSTTIKPNILLIAVILVMLYWIIS